MNSSINLMKHLSIINQNKYKLKNSFFHLIFKYFCLFFLHNRIQTTFIHLKKMIKLDTCTLKIKKRKIFMNIIDKI